MPNVLASGDLDRLAARIGGWIAGSVAASPTPTTTQFAITGYDLTAAPSLAGALVVVGHTTRQVGQVQSNSGSTLTLSKALDTAPAVGDPVVIFPQVAVNFSGAENIQEVGAKALPTDTSGNPYLPVESALDVVPLQTIANQGANASFASFTAPLAGRALLLISLATSSLVNLVVTPVGGTATNLGAINNGTALNANQPYTFEWPVSKGATYALQVATAQSGTLTVSIEVMLT